MSTEPIVVHVRGRTRLDRYLTRLLAHVSRTRIQRHIASGDVLVDGRRVRPSHVLQGGEVVTLPALEAQLADAAPAGDEAESLGLCILHEDADLLVVDKPAGLVVHPVGGEFRRTLLNLLRDLLRRRGEEAPELGLVHRLDRSTSGLIVVAKRLATRRALARDVEERRVRRQYLGVVVGQPPQRAGTIDLFIRRDPSRPTRMQALDAAAAADLRRAGFASPVSASGYSDPRLDVRPRAARTHWSVLRRLLGATLLRLDLDTGRTHQIRVHLQGAGMPLLGDPIYGPFTHTRGRAVGGGEERDDVGPRDGERAALLAASRALGRPALHAAMLAFTHPRSGVALRFRAPLPADLRALLARLGRPPTRPLA